VGDRALRSYTYLADGLAAETDAFGFQMRFPWGAHGTLLQWDVAPGAVVEATVEHALHCGLTAEQRRPVAIDVRGRRAVISDGVYSLAFHAGEGCAIKRGATRLRLTVAGERTARVVVVFHTDAGEAERQAAELLAQFAAAIERSALFWEEYLQSCPLHPFDGGYTYADSSGAVVHLPAEMLLTRQLWHWWAALVNVGDVAFNLASPYLAPDRTHWQGSWSNDSPETMCALALTNQRDLARRCIVRYIADAINDAGDLGWYTHNYGRSCLGHSHDSGFYSHGVPTIVHTVEFYIRHTGDTSILDEAAGSLTIWEKLRRYLERVFVARDLDGDGLIEWRNLWETGWDNKVGPFFSRAPLERWVEVMSRNDPAELAVWYDERCCPVTALAEQVHLLTALASMAHLARRRGDEALASSCAERYARIRQVIEARHWSEATGFYHDWDVQSERLVEAMQLDAVYYLYHSERHDRAERVVAWLSDPAAFGLPHPPTLSAGHPQFEPGGYWNGSYWPREMFYVALALHRHGHDALALRELAKALCSQEASIVGETLDPFTLRSNSQVYTMAYGACLGIALLELRGAPVWLPPEPAARHDA
jgi:hypothetical protein